MITQTHFLRFNKFLAACQWQRLVLFFMLVFWMGVGFSQNCASRDREALVALYNATGGANWVDNTNWLSDRPLIEWYGVTTDANGCVVNISLSGNDLNGTIPTDLGQLTNLTNLDLSYNQMIGIIPSEIGQLTNLTRLVLRGNQLTGAIPPEIGQLTNLTILNLNRNQLTGAIPPEIGQLINLVSLILWDNQLTGAIPPEIGQLANLDWLYLWNNQLTGAIPPEIGQLTNLTQLVLRSNQLTGTLPSEIGQLANLVSLSLQSNKLTGTIPPEIGQLINLVSVLLSYNNLSGCFPEHSNRLCYLTNSNARDYCTENNITLEGCQYDFRNNPQLPWQGDFARFCNGESQIGALCDDGNASTENDVIQADCSCRGTIVAINDCVARDRAALEALYNSTDGDNWTDKTNWLSDRPLGEWYGVTTDAQGCVIKLSMRNCNTVCAGNSLSGSIPKELGNLSNLTSLELITNELSGSIPKELGNLSNLTSLSLGENELSGSVPKELGNLSNLTSLHLGFNNLSGNIPKELGNLTNLTWLHLGFNNLSGSIPKELGNLSNLTSLYLSDNNLSGCFPENLSKLCYLTNTVTRNTCSEDEQKEGCQYDFRNNPQLPWGGDFVRFCNAESQIGATCNDGDASTENDVIQADCSCIGEYCATAIQVEYTATPACPNTSNGVVTIHSPAPNSSYQYNFGGGFSTANIIIGLVAGTYSVTIQDANGCSVEQSLIVPSGAIPQAVAGSNQRLSCALTTVTLGGTANPAYTYNWSGPAITVEQQTQVNPVINQAGDYTLTVVNEAGCTATATAIITTDADTPIANAGANMELTCTNNLAILNATGSTTGANITYLWTGEGLNSAELQQAVNRSGIYTLIVTNTTTGCTASDEIVVTENTDLPSVSPVAAIALSCTQSTTVLAFAVERVATFAWTGPNGFTSSEVQPTVSIPGTYTLIGTAENGCIASASVEITGDSTSPIANAGSDGILSCTNTSFILDASSSSRGNDFTYAWTGQGINSSASQQVVNLPGTYTLVVTNTNNGCIASDQVTVTENRTTPTALTGPPQQLTCNISSLTLGGAIQPNLNYAWTGQGITVANQNQPNPVISQSGTYTLLVTDAINGCTASQSVTIGSAELVGATCDDGDASTENDVIQADCSCTGTPTIGITVSSTTVSCSTKGAIMVQISGGNPTYTISWEGPVISYEYTVDTSYTISDLAAGVYTITVTDSGGNYTSETITIESEESSNLAIRLYPTRGKCGQEGLISIAIAGGMPPYTINWEGSISDSKEINDIIYVIPNLDAGDYQITVKDAKDCANTSSIKLEANSENISIGTHIATPITCDRLGAIGIRGITGTASYTIVWEGPIIGTINTSEDWYNIEALPAGKYTIKITDANDCSTGFEETIHNSTLYFCLKEEPTPDGTAYDVRFDIRHGEQPYTLNIWDENRALYSTKERTSNIFKENNLPSGSYHFEILDKNGCHQEQTFRVGAASNTIQATICEGDFYAFGEHTYTQTGSYELHACPDSYIGQLDLTVGSCSPFTTDPSNTIAARIPSITAPSTKAAKAPSIDFTIFPNPASQVLHIQFTEASSPPISVRLLTLTGQEVAHYRPMDKEDIRVDLTGFSDGVYIVKVMDVQGRFITEKLIIHSF